MASTGRTLEKRACLFSAGRIWGFPKIRDARLGVPIIGIIVFWGLYWGARILESSHIVYSLGHSGECTSPYGKRVVWGVMGGIMQ